MRKYNIRRINFKRNNDRITRKETYENYLYCIIYKYVTYRYSRDINEKIEDIINHNIKQNITLKNQQIWQTTRIGGLENIIIKCINYNTHIYNRVLTQYIQEKIKNPEIVVETLKLIGI